MNHLHSLLGLPLLLLLLPQFWVPTRAEERNVVLLAPPEVHGFLGGTVILPCNLQPVESEILRVKQIRWKQWKPWGDLSTVAEFDWEQGPSILEPDHVQFVAAGKHKDLLDASLTLTDLHPDEEANYTCEVTTFQNGSGRASTWLQVYYTPHVSITRLEEIGEQGGKKISLSCYADSKPKHFGYEWSTTSGPLPPSAVPQGPRLLLQSSEETIDTTFICRVSNAVGTGQATLKVLLPGSSWSLLDIKIPVIVPLMVLCVITEVIILILLSKLCQDSPSENDVFSSSSSEEAVRYWADVRIEVDNIPKATTEPAHQLPPHIELFLNKVKKTHEKSKARWLKAKNGHVPEEETSSIPALQRP